MAWHTENVGDLKTSYLLNGPAETMTSEKAELTLANSIAFGKMLLIDGELQSTERDEYIYHEMLVHPLASINGPVRVKIYGGGEGATAREVLRWPCVKKVVQVDWDAQLLEHFRTKWTGWSKGSFDDPRLELRVEDAFMDADKEKYDYIIIDLPDPDNIDDFRVLLRSVALQLSENGSFVMNAGPVQPWDGGFAEKLCEVIHEEFPSYEYYSWHTNVPSFAAAGEWCFLGAKTIREPVYPLTPLRPFRRFSELVWKYASYWPDDYPEELIRFSSLIN